jgi:hypothetical protein
LREALQAGLDAMRVVDQRQPCCLADVPVALTALASFDALLEMRA